jgi:hypothetical protein
MTLPDPAGSRSAATRSRPVFVLPSVTGARSPRARRCTTGRLVAGVVLQSCQALAWMVTGLLIGLDDGPVHRDDPGAVVLVIAAILVFSIGGFGLGLSAGTIGRSDECRIASVVFQVVFGVLFLAGSLGLCTAHGGAATRVLLGPTAALAISLGPALLVLTPVSCLLIAFLLACRPSSWTTRAARQPRPIA